MNNSRRSTVAALTALLLVAPFTTQTASAVPGPESTRDFVALIELGDHTRACTGALVDAAWILTAASCFDSDPADGITVPAGRPSLATVATIGRADLTGTTGQVRDVVELVPHASRDLVLGRLATPVTDITPVAIGTTPATPGETLELPGYGRTATEWAPLRQHSGSFTVNAVTGADVALTGVNGAVVCAGDTGGPALRVSSGGVELVAVNSRSWQGGCWGVPATETRTGAVDTRVDDLRSWLTDTVGRNTTPDFNCDGVRDIAIADPNATVGGIARAGVVRVVYGGNAMNPVEISQASAGVPDDPETDDRFGVSIATYDRNLDGCTDLAVGIPYEHQGSAADAGGVSVIHGAPAGLTRGPASLAYRQGAGTGALANDPAEAGDNFGYALAAGHVAGGTPYLLIGVPNEDIRGFTNAGMAYYLQGDRPSQWLNQDSTDVASGVEAGDQFGFAVAADSHFIVIGAPSEDDTSGHTNIGMVHVHRHTLNSSGFPAAVRGLNEGTDGGVSGAPENGDQVGYSLDIVEYRPSGAATATDSMLVIGSPGESIGDVASAGHALLFHVTSRGTVTEVGNVNQDSANVLDQAEAGDRFGARVAITNTSPRAVGTATTMRIAVGVPHDVVTSKSESGMVQVFAGVAPLVDATQFLLIAGRAGLPGIPGTNEQLGSVITMTDTHLYVGMPHGPSAYGAVHTIPLANVTSGDTAPVTTYQPGAGGIPAAGVSFGSAVR
jgi:hypothetical protein